MLIFSLEVNKRCSSRTDLQGVWGFDVDADQGPASRSVRLRPPDLLEVAQLVSGEHWEDVSPLLVSVVVEGQAAGHGRRRHRWGQLGYFLELLGVHGVHVHVVAWAVRKKETQLCTRVGSTEYVHMIGWWLDGGNCNVTLWGNSDIKVMSGKSVFSAQPSSLQ